MKNACERTEKEKYPRQILAAESRVINGVTTTLSVDQLLGLPGEAESPMKMFIGWSVFRICIMNDNNAEKVMKNPMANINASEVPYLYEKTLWCNQKHWDCEWNSVKRTDRSTPNSPAYTIKLAGKFAGKTAAQFLIEKGADGKAQLLSQKEWLEKNLSGKYGQSNKEQITGINDALELFANGKLAEGNAENITPQILVNEPVRKYFREKKTIDGKIYNKVYEIRIVFDAGRKYPYTISIKNSYCSVKEIPGSVSVIGNENLEPSYGEIRLTAGRWLQYIQTMNNRLLEHEITHYPKQERIMDMYSWKPSEKELTPEAFSEVLELPIPILILKCKDNRNGTGVKVRVAYKSPSIGDIILRGQLKMENGTCFIVAENADTKENNGYNAIMNNAKWKNTPLLKEGEDIVILKDFSDHCVASTAKVKNVCMEQILATLE